VVFTYGNYAGDVMNFGLAGERLTDSGIPSRQVIVTDDIASAPPEEREKRRGIAGDVVVFKTMSAAAEEGADLDEVVRIGTRTNDATYTIGVAFDGCTFPGADHKHFTVPEGKMGLGLGIHGEPGQRDIDWLPAANLAALLVQRLLDERPPAAGPRVAVILNGLGATKYEELFVLWAAVARLLREAGLTLVGPEVGELVTSLDMAGVSLTLTWLDEELERLWLAPCDTPAFRRGSIGGTGAAEATRDEEITDEVIHDDT
jgi:dihydroxyacetone kinase